MLDITSVALCRGVVRPEDFGIPHHAAIWAAILALVDSPTPPADVDAVQLAAVLEAQGAPVSLDRLLDIDQAGTAVNADRHAVIVRDAADRRRFIEGATALVTRARKADGGTVDELASLGADVMAGIAAGRMSGDDVAGATAFDAALKHAANTDAIGRRMRTGLVDLDRMVDIRDGKLLVVGARPGMGKTSFAAGLAHTMLRAGRAVLFASLEMEPHEVALRMIAALARVNGRDLENGIVQLFDQPRVERAHADLCALPMQFTTAMTLDAIEAAAHRMAHAKPRLGMVVIDYLQMLAFPKAGRRNREELVADASKRAKRLARRLGAVVVLLVQLNRDCEKRPNKRPIMPDIRESGGVEQDADVILFLYRDEVYNPVSPDKGVAEVIVAKNRSGPTGTARLHYAPEWTLFQNLDDKPSTTPGWKSSRGGQ